MRNRRPQATNGAIQYVTSSRITPAASTVFMSLAPMIQPDKSYLPSHDGILRGTLHALCGGQT
eukprot:scaffold7207_cov520-Prasinococcus_capsulatus_cf.AAC.13